MKLLRQIFAVWVVLFVGGHSWAGAQETSGDLASYKNALAKFNLVPLKPEPGVLSVRWISFGFRMPSRSVTVKIIDRVANLSVVECERRQDDAAGPVRLRKKSTIKLEREPFALQGMRRQGNEGFWRPLSEIEDFLIESVRDGGVWWLEYAKDTEHNFLYLPQLDFLLQNSSSGAAEVRDFYTICSYYDVVDFMKELVMSAGFVGWTDET